jgi:peptidoglycan-associated lipoprotein
MLKTPFFTVMLAASVISACGTAPTRDSSAQDIVPISDTSVVVRPVTIDGVQGFENVDPNSIEGRAPLERVIYFDYDQSELRTEFLDIVAKHGRFLAQNPAGRVRLEGHTDERGTREYNIALGEARAKTIARMLQLQGVDEAQSRTVSYGEELPVDEAHNNDAWAKNRRVNVIYESEIQN